MPFSTASKALLPPKRKGMHSSTARAPKVQVATAAQIDAPAEPTLSPLLQEGSGMSLSSGNADMIVGAVSKLLQSLSFSQMEVVKEIYSLFLNIDHETVIDQ